MKRALLTGASGFVGANLARRLLRDGHEVHLLLRPSHAPWRVEEIRSAVRAHEAELADRASVASLLERVRPDWVFHLAAHGAYASQTDVREMVRTNVLGTLNLVEAALAHGVQAIVHTGSSSEYGFKDHAPREDEALEPNSDYAVTKAAATLFCAERGRVDHAPVVTLRLYSVYGPYEEPTRLIPRLVTRGLEGELPPLVAPETARDYVHVDDVVEAYLGAAAAAARLPGAVFNVGTGTQTTLREVVGAARDLLSIAREPEWGSMPARSWDTATWVADARRIQAELGWRPRYAFRAGLAATIEWFRTLAPGLRDRYDAA